MANPPGWRARYTGPMPRRVILLYVVGAPSSPAVRERFGTFADWFQALLARHDDLEVRTVDATRGHGPEALGAGPDGLGGGDGLGGIDGLDGVVITGSPASLTAPEPWMEPGLALVRAAHAAQTPLLGVCFGHQLIGAALGGRVIRNPLGWELGSHEIALTDAGRDDPLLAGLPDRFHANFSHQDIVAEDSLAGVPGVRVLAGNGKAAVQALAAGPRVRGVQFHPEFSGAVTAAYIEARREVLAEDARQRQSPEDLPEQLMARVRDCPEGEQVLHNFVRYFVQRSAA
jgi:GMP synthase (glutamine-hydrolysing)